MTSGKVCLVEVLRDIPGIVTVVKKEVTRIMHEPPAATADLAILLSELEALRAGSRASSGLGPCDVLNKYASGPVPRYRGMVAQWHDHLHDLATASRT